MAKLLKTVDLVTNFYTYEGVVKALNKVSLVVDHGITFGLIGESGCGKSVTALSIMRIVQEPGRIEGGKVIVFLDEKNRRLGVDLLQQSETYMEGLRGDHISMIFQEPSAALNPTMSIGDQVSESFLFHQKKQMCAKVLEDLCDPQRRAFYPLRKLQQVLYRAAVGDPDFFFLKVLETIPVMKLWQRRLKKEARRRSVEIIAKLGIPHPEQIIEQYPHNLSGGMKQRIVIAMALDVSVQAQILNLIKSLQETLSLTFMFVTHHLLVVKYISDRTAVMYLGKIAEIANTKTIFSRPVHPYTHALLSDIPIPDMKPKKRRIVLSGDVPSPINPPQGCRFHTRCPFAVERCWKEEPPLEEVENAHMAACHRRHETERLVAERFG